jgi:sugar-specific transcriptional regulator TrmB
MFMTLQQVLTGIGLQETEARCYLAALELGPSSVREIAKRAGISRTNAYDVLSRLAEQGLVSEAASAGKTMLVAAEPPQHLLNLVDQRRLRLKDIMPELHSLHNGSTAKPRVRFYEGVDGIKTVLNETLSCRSKILRGILSMRDLFQATGREWMQDLVRRRIEASVFLRVVRSHVKDLPDLWPESLDDLRELRFCPDPFVFSMTTYIYDDKVALISSSRENFALTIESTEFATMQSHLFEALWAASYPQDLLEKRAQDSNVVRLRPSAGES